ncbi:hypothetical protein [Myroides odoratimimus]|uniref:hypothetical protein n=1 Tax=Myroides odoratimimus TaxID=76832 RepID=UPI00310155A1
MLNDYNDLVSVGLIPMIIAIFAIAFPLLLQTISRIDDKYNSTKLIETFRKENVSQVYIIVLIFTICAYGIWLLQLPRITDIECLNGIIDNSALLLLIIGTIALITCTFCIVQLTYIYYVPEKLLEHLIKKYNDSEDKEKLVLFESISKILLYSIQKSDESLARKLFTFYFETFINFRVGKENTPVVYPQEYYDAIFEANELLCTRQKRTISYFNDSTFFSLFLDEYQETIISANTYRFMWMCLLQIINHNQDDAIIAYWKKAHQLRNLFLTPVNRSYSEGRCTNDEEARSREIQIEDFIEFHYALGGLLMYKGKYEIIKEIINWTSQSPPKYVLVPESMKEVITRYMEVSQKGGYINPVYYEQKYPFPKLSGFNADGIIQKWIKRYLSILFLRQYTLPKYHTYSNRLLIPSPPTDLSEMKIWNQELEKLNEYTSEYLKKQSVLKRIGLSLTTEWFSENQKETPSEMINNLKSKINSQFDNTKSTQTIDRERLVSFEEKTKKILNKTFNDYSLLFTGNLPTDYKSFSIGGDYKIMEKAGFAANQEIHYVNSDSILAQAVALNFKYQALNVFIKMNNTKYVLRDQDVFSAIDKLSINHNDFVIIAIGFNLGYISMLNINGLEQSDSEWYYKQIRIIEIENYMNEAVSQSLFIIQKNDLPKIEHNEITAESITKYGLKIIDETTRIYTNLIDLNDVRFTTIKQEIETEETEENLSKFVLACVDIHVKILYKTEAKCIQIKTFSQFDDRSTHNEVYEINSIWN